MKKIYVGLSGGLDSTVLLHTLACVPEIALKLQAIHVNHGLSVHADSWQRHCEQVCQMLEVPFHVKSVTFGSHANLEAQARAARYQCFAPFIERNDALVLGHHEDDQAETLLLNLMRGTGIDGLGAMFADIAWGDGYLLRPLLTYSRERLLHYAKTHQLTWIDDESNLNERYARNFLRHRVIPLLQEYWPAAKQSLSRTAHHCQHAKVHLEQLAGLDCSALEDTDEDRSVLPVAPLLRLPRERALNVIGVWLKGLGFQRPSAVTMNRILDELVFARIDGMPLISWGEVQLRRYQNDLYCTKRKETFEPTVWQTFPVALPLGDKILQARPTQQGFIKPAESQLAIRFRQGGEQLRWHGQTKSLKQLFQEWKIPPWLRDTIPLIYVDDRLAVVVGYAVSDIFYGETIEKLAWDIVPYPLV